MSEHYPILGEDNLIYAYTREMALKDGMLIDVTDTAREAGFKIPVALTIGAWRDCVAWTAEDTAAQVPQDQSGRLWDVLWMAFMGALRNKQADRYTYEVLRVERDGKAKRATKVELVVHIGPGDEGEPVITIMFPGED